MECIKTVTKTSTPEQAISEVLATSSVVASYFFFFIVYPYKLHTYLVNAVESREFKQQQQQKTCFSRLSFGLGKGMLYVVARYHTFAVDAIISP